MTGHLSAIEAVANPMPLRAFVLETRVLVSDGSQPVGQGIGPALEARDMLAVLQNSADAPADLAKRAFVLAGALLELGGRASPGGGVAPAADTVADGRAWAKFQAQGAMRVPPVSRQREPLHAPFSGTLRSIDNRRIASLAKLAGAPGVKAAGVELHGRLGQAVEVGQPLCTVHADTAGQLQYALDYASGTGEIFGIERA
jgi:thymidine phosphorylase